MKEMLLIQMLHFGKYISSGKNSQFFNCKVHLLFKAMFLSYTIPVTSTLLLTYFIPFSIIFRSFMLSRFNCFASFSITSSRDYYGTINQVMLDAGPLFGAVHQLNHCFNFVPIFRTAKRIHSQQILSFVIISSNTSLIQKKSYSICLLSVKNIVDTTKIEAKKPFRDT